MWLKQICNANRILVFNSVKVIVAALSAITLADVLKLHYSISAGIVAILTIQPTKKETIETAGNRFVAFLVSLCIACSCYSVLGFRLSGFFAYLAVYIFVCHILHWYYAMTMNAVLISHFVNYGVMNTETIINEVCIFIIGVGTGILANLHLRKKVDTIETLKQEADKQIIEILHRMADCMVDVECQPDDMTCFIELKKQIRRAKNLAEENYLNQFNKNDRYDIEYIMMRDRQCQVLYEMYKNVCQLNDRPESARVIACFMKRLATEFHRDNDGVLLMEQFRELDVYMKKTSLPIERQEFENRARLFVAMRNIEELIQIKMDFYWEHVRKSIE